MCVCVGRGRAGLYLELLPLLAVQPHVVVVYRHAERHLYVVLSNNIPAMPDIHVTYASVRAQSIYSKGGKAGKADVIGLAGLSATYTHSSKPLKISLGVSTRKSLLLSSAMVVCWNRLGEEKEEAARVRRPTPCQDGHAGLSDATARLHKVPTVYVHVICGQ